MTTIAWDGELLAGDRRITSAGNVVTSMTKVKRRKDGALIGVAGEMCTTSEYIRWFMAGEEGDAPSLKAKNSPEECGAVIIVRADGTVEAHDRDGWHVVESKQYAIGSGAIAAMVAMRLRNDAAAAVALASEFDVYSGDGVDAVHYG